MEITEADIGQLRSAFYKNIEDEGLVDTEAFHPFDINKINSNGDWLRRFLLHHDNNQKEALTMLWDTCQWRKKNNVNDISEKNVDMSILQEGSLFAHGKDKDGKSLLIFKSKKHVKGAHKAEELQRVLIYWLERLERENNGEMMSVFFDMDGAGMSNMDMDYTKVLIGLLKDYYPFFLNNIYIFEMAWILNAAFKIIKTWLPPKAVQKIKFISKKDIKEYVDVDNSLKSWGGKDEYEFTFIPEVRLGGGEGERKKVHFADHDAAPTPESPTQSSMSEQIAPSSTTNKLNISPSDVMTFTTIGSELTGTIRLTNEDSTYMSYKIKTTSPEKFRVRPSGGILASGESVTVTVVLQVGYDGSSLARDKFLIMALSVVDPSVDFVELWKSAGNNILQHRVRCALPSALMTDSVRNGTVQDGDRQFTKLSTEISKLHSQLHVVNDEVRRIQIQQWVLIILVGLLAALNMYLSRTDSYGGQNSCFTPSPHD